MINRPLDASESYIAEAWSNDGFVKFAREISKMIADGETALACVEKVGAMPKQGVTSTFTFGKSAGFIEGVLSACGIPYQLVTPHTWKKEFMLDKSKQKSIDVCRKLFPNVSLYRTERCTTMSDGIAEAMLMAEYCRRKM